MLPVHCKSITSTWKKNLIYLLYSIQCQVPVYFVNNLVTLFSSQVKRSKFKASLCWGFGVQIGIGHLKSSTWDRFGYNTYHNMSVVFLCMRSYNLKDALCAWEIIHSVTLDMNQYPAFITFPFWHICLSAACIAVYLKWMIRYNSYLNEIKQCFTLCIYPRDGSWEISRAISVQRVLSLVIYDRLTVNLLWIILFEFYGDVERPNKKIFLRSDELVNRSNE